MVTGEGRDGRSDWQIILSTILAKPYPTLVPSHIPHSLAVLLSQSNCSTVSHHLHSCSTVFGQLAYTCVCTNFLDLHELDSNKN